MHKQPLFRCLTIALPARRLGSRDWVIPAAFPLHPPPMTIRTTALALLPALILATSAQAQVSATMSAMPTFGGGDGWLAPGENGYTFLTTGSTERGLSYST